MVLFCWWSTADLRLSFCVGAEWADMSLCEFVAVDMNMTVSEPLWKLTIFCF